MENPKPQEKKKARAALAEYFGKFTLAPTNEGTYSVQGEADFFGSEVCGANRWCRGPESNWLRPPFQGGALPVSYPGTS
jgi:hypothetical protein